MVWKGFTATVVIIAFFVLDRTMAALGHGHSHGHGHDEEEGSTSDETRTTRESTPDMKSSLDIKPILKDSNIPKLSLASKVLLLIIERQECMLIDDGLPSDKPGFRGQWYGGGCRSCWQSLQVRPKLLAGSFTDTSWSGTSLKAA